MNLSTIFDVWTTRLLNQRKFLSDMNGELIDMIIQTSSCLPVESQKILQKQIMEKLDEYNDMMEADNKIFASIMQEAE